MLARLSQKDTKWQLDLDEEIDVKSFQTPPLLNFLLLFYKIIINNKNAYSLFKQCKNVMIS